MGTATMDTLKRKKRQAYLVHYSPTKPLSVSDLNVNRSSDRTASWLRGVVNIARMTSIRSIDRRLVDCRPSDAQAVAYRRGKAIPIANTTAATQ